MSSNDYYNSIKHAVDESTEGEERVEVNQRALIDKILARYASAGAVYRELLQNSNDAESTIAEIYFTTNRDEIIGSVPTKDGSARKAQSVTQQQSGDADKRNDTISTSGKEVVTNVTYRNNGLRFRPQDWSRLKKIAEGNPDESKIGAFGVGAYTMFSICEEPMVLSGTQALAFFWKGDALWSKTITTANRSKTDEAWTTFVLPSRDPYALPNLVEFGEFLCASLTFTKCLGELRVYVNEKRRLTIVKTPLQEPTVVKINLKNKHNSWFSWTGESNKGGVVTASPYGLFELKDDQSLLESIYHVQVELDGNVAAVTARYLSASAMTKFPVEMIRRMERVTKKKPPSKVEVQIFLSHDQTINDDGKRQRKDQDVRRIVKSFSPRIGEGRIFIGFRTSQTTGLAAHLAAPFVPTVEREAMDLQDQTLRIFNLELLDFAGIIMRMTLEHSMTALGVDYEKGASKRKDLEIKLLQEARKAEIEKEKLKNSGGGNKTEHNQDSVEVDTSSTTKKGKSKKASALFGFAKFMANGVTKSIKKVVNNISDLVDDAGGGELIHPLDPRPLCVEEHQCILLMQSFCPRQSTPDPLVGTALAQGFSRCIDRAPPVLTRSGVVPGDQGRLPNKGMEAFVDDFVIRAIVYQNAEEYHDVIAQCRKLSLEDLTQKFSKDVMDENKLIRLIKWWVKYNKVQSNVSLVEGAELKDVIRFFLENSSNQENNEALPVYYLNAFLFYLDKDRIRCGHGYDVHDLPMPDSILPKHIQDEVSTRIISDKSLNVWFSPLPIEIWIDFVSQHPCMASGQPEYEKVRLQVLSTLGNEHRNRTLTEKRLFGNFCQNLFQDKRCLPFDSAEPTSYSADLPSNLYLDSAELDMFGKLGNFHKVSKSLYHMGVSDEFLISLGVRKSVAIDFLFENLNTLNYTDDPKPLVEYLRTASLTKADFQKLKNCQYLPAENDLSQMFAPAELYLPDSTFRIFPFVRSLQWPSEDEVTERSPNGKFLVSLGVKALPDLLQILRYISFDVTDDALRLHCLDFVAKRLGSGGVYQLEYSRLSRSIKANLKFLPCVIVSPLSGGNKQTCCSVINCYSKPEPGVMGFATLHVDDKNKLYGNLFQCTEEPPPTVLLKQLQSLVTLSKKTLGALSGGKEKALFSQKLVATFYRIFNYMSSRSSEIDSSTLFNEEFIPCLVDGEIQWFQPAMVFFKSKSIDENGDITQSLFQVVDFSPFLASTGVRQEASTRDIFRRMIDSPKAVMAAVKNEENYRALLRRVAAHPPFRRVTDEIRNSPFLLAYSVSEEKSSNDKVTFELAKASDIFVIDNSFFGRMFPVKRAPHESDLEEFYALLGSSYISKVVQKKFDVIGAYQEGTTSTKILMERIQERSPLLLSSGNSSRSLLMDGAPTILEQKNLEIIQAPALKAIYSLGKSTRTQKTTCCVRQKMFKKNSILVTMDFDWFDVGFAIGELILKRCQLEDAFFISSLLEAPLEQLRARGFPVDRIIKTEPPPAPEPKLISKKHSSVSESMDPNISDVKSNNSKMSFLPKKETEIENTTNSMHERPTNDGEDNGEHDRASVQSKGCIDDHISMLKQMYPGVDESYLRQKLGQNPSVAEVRSIAEEMTLRGYPKNDVATRQTNTLKKEEQKSSKLLGSKKLGKALKNLGGLPNQLKPAGTQSLGPGTGKASNVVPKDDAILHSNMERILQKKVQNSPQVGAKGIKSSERLISIPEGLDHGNSCEVVPSQDIAPFVGKNGKFESHNGIKLFYFRKDQSSKDYMNVNYDAVESFAVVMERLCNVFELRLTSIAIYHDPSGRAIAFNSGGALYFNVRYFYGLHYSKNIHRSRVCYSYWYTVMCHELAHNMEGPHNSTHGFYTESYTSLYLPKLMAIFEKGDV